jgi:serine phosphatase RsbU (regulator of sigma subunit)/Tfp pilus assembly protein PilF
MKVYFKTSEAYVIKGLLILVLLFIILRCSSNPDPGAKSPEIINTAVSTPENLIPEKQATSIDSLKKALSIATQDTIRAEILNSLAIAEKNDTSSHGYDKQLEILIKNILASNPSTELDKKCKRFLYLSTNRKGDSYYSMEDYKNAQTEYYRSLAISEELNDKALMAECLHNIGTVYDDLGDYTKALEFYLKSLPIQEETGDIKNVAYTYNNMGLVYSSQGDVPKALEYYNKCLKILEELGDKHGISYCENNLGLIYHSQGDLQKAEDYYNKSLAIKYELSDKQGISMSLSNLGLIHLVRKDFPTALDYYNRALKISEELKDKSGISESYSNIGTIFSEKATDAKKQNEISKSDSLFKIAFNYHRNSLQICEELNDKFGTATALVNIGLLYLKTNRLEKALGFAERAYAISRKNGYPQIIKDACEILDEIFVRKGNFELSRKYYGEYIEMRDSLSKQENLKLAQIKYFQYEYEKKVSVDSIAFSNALEIKNLEIDKQKAESKRQKQIIAFIFSGFLVVLFLALIIFRTLRITRKQKTIIEEQKHLVDEKNEMLSEQNEEIKAQRDEIETQRDKVTEQKLHIEEIHKEVSDSINYARRIQQAVLPSGEYADSILGDHFILFKPKDVVSGDFYWATKINDYLVFCVADCTGHGVPGAFMSMLGISFLNEIVRKKEVIIAAEILEQLRKSVIEALRQSTDVGSQKDGMDIAICVLNKNSLEIQFAGADSTIYLIPHDTKELQEIKGDKMPIGIFENMKTFTNHVIKVKKGDLLYLSSDGYSDQFGGPHDKKFLSGRLKKLLEEIHLKPMDEQREILNITLSDWGENHEQTDDVTVLGIKM